MVHDVKDVPVPWIFEHFCKLKVKLTGQDMMIKSLFNPKERTPSMSIYYDKKKQQYRFNDFSTGKWGSSIDLVKDLNQITYHQACRLIVETYNEFVLHNNGGYDVGEFKQASKYKVSQYVLRSWDTSDQYFWTKFNIGSKLLDEHCVRPLSSYTLEKEEEGIKKSVTITGNYLYGYFKKDGTLYKIYQPKTLDKKFIKVNDYIQGLEQLKGHKYLVITSSLKDIMALKSLKLSIDIIAPDSENTMIPKDMMKHCLKEYSKVLVMFDFDDAGIKATEKYIKMYPELTSAILPMSKDPADSIRDHGAKKVLYTLVPLINKKLENL